MNETVMSEKMHRPQASPMKKGHTAVLGEYLIAGSLLYLSLPYIIFFAGWLKWYIAGPCIGLILIVLLLCFQEGRRHVERSQQPRLTWNSLILMLLTAAVLLGISGVGGYGYQDSDWLKHNTILRDLVNRPWPVVYEIEDVHVPLVYYIAYLLPAALVGKLGGWFWANQALFVWTYVGLVLAMLWYVKLIRRPYLALLLFVVFSGLDAVGQIIITPLGKMILGTGDLSWDHIEWWAVGWQYASNATLLFWVPNQAISGWIIAGMTMYTVLHPPWRKYILFAFSLTALWSPFVTIGIAPYVIVDFVTEASPLSKRLKPYLSLPNITGGALLIIIGLFYISKFADIPLSWEMESVHGLIFTFTRSVGEFLGVVFLIPLFCVLEFGIYGMIIHKGNPTFGRKHRVMFMTTLICLALLPFYRYGYWNDMTMRASIPPLFFLAIFLGMTLERGTVNKVNRVLIALIVIGAMTPLVEYRRHIRHICQTGSLATQQEFVEVQALLADDESTEEEIAQVHTLVLQYAGSLQSPFFEGIARRP